MGISKGTTYRKHGRHLVAIRSVLSLAQKAHQLTRKMDAHLPVESAIHTGPSYADPDEEQSTNTDNEFGAESDTEDNLPEMLNVRCLFNLS